MKAKTEPAEEKAIEELLRIERECFTAEAYSREHIRRLLKSPSAVALLARMDGDVAGFVIGLVERRRTAKIGHVVTIDVAAKYRQMGVGLMLLKEIENAFLKKSVEAVYLEVRADNQAARRLYRKQGYEEAIQLDDYYSAGVHGLRLVKDLKQKQYASS